MQMQKGSSNGRQQISMTDDSLGLAVTARTLWTLAEGE